MATTLKLDHTHTHTPTRSRSLKRQVEGSESVPGLLAPLKDVEECWSAGVLAGLGARVARLVGFLWVLDSWRLFGCLGPLGPLGHRGLLGGREMTRPTCLCNYVLLRTATRYP